jgi:hypothetical protein
MFLYNYTQFWQLKINDWTRPAPFLARPRMSSLLLWRTKNSCSRLELHTNSLLTSEFWLPAFCLPLWVWVLCYDRRSVGQSILEWSTQLGLTTRFVDVGRSLWRKDGSVVYNFCWPWPAQSLSGLGLATIFCCLKFETSFSSPPTTRRATVEVFDHASTRNT